MPHIILMNPELDQVETHKVDAARFLEVYDLLHSDKKPEVIDGLSFGAAAAVPAIQDAIAEQDTYHPANDPAPQVDALADALANSTDSEPEPVNGNAQFAASLQALFT